MTHTKREKLKILLVDDEQHILTALEFLMEQQGYDVITASSGEQAIEKWSKHHPHLIILDVMMSGINGFDVAKKIRNADHNKAVSIIFLTAKGATSDRTSGYSSGGDIYITKPFDNEDLVNTVNELLVYE